MTIPTPARLLLLLLALSLGGCGWIGGIFSGSDAEEPARLTDFDEEVALQRRWRINVGNGQGDKYNRLTPAIDGPLIFAASNNGSVVAVDRESGERLWRTRLDDGTITGGVGAAAGLVLVGTENSSVVALSQEDGEILWETGVSSEVLAAPATNGQIVVAQSIDGNLTALDAGSGDALWLYESTVPALSLRGTSAPLIIGNFVVAAFGNGTVVSVALDNGTLRWEERVAIPTGRSEIDRLIDIDGEVLQGDGGQLVVPSYQGYLAVLDPVTGQTRWRTEASTPMSSGTGFGNIYITDERSHVEAYRQGQNSTVWANEQLQLRRLSPPTGFSNYVAVGDFEGYVHLLSQVDGRFVGRTRVDNDGVRARMLVQGNTLYVYGNSGTLAAYRVRSAE